MKESQEGKREALINQRDSNTQPFSFQAGTPTTVLQPFPFYGNLIYLLGYDLRCRNNWCRIHFQFLFEWPILQQSFVVNLSIFSKLPQQVAKKFGLVSKALPSGTGETSSGGPGYVFNGVYQPLACKIVQETLRPANPKIGITDSLKEFQIPHKLITGEPFVLFNLKNMAI